MKYCKDNNPSAQKMLYNKYVDSMMILCLRYVVNTEDAKEVLMDGFLNFFKNISGFTYRGEGSVRAWLKKIVVNQCLAHLRMVLRKLICTTQAVRHRANHELVKNLHGFDLWPPGIHHGKRPGALFPLHHAIDTIDDGDREALAGSTSNAHFLRPSGFLVAGCRGRFPIPI